MKKIQRPEVKTGIWLDQEKAYVIRMVGDALPVIEKIKSEVESRVRIPGESKVFARFGQSFLDDQEKKQHRQAQQRQLFFREIITHLADADYIAVFGPGPAKQGLVNAIEKSKTLKGQLVALEPADKITKAQMLQWVKNYFEGGDFRLARRKMKREKSIH